MSPSYPPKRSASSVEAAAPVSRIRLPWWAWVIGIAAGLPLMWIGFRSAPTRPPEPVFSENDLRALVNDRAVVARGQALWGSCVGCHGAVGEGSQGPNLRDDYWLHGSDMTDIVRSIAEGNAVKAMPVWKNFMTPEDIRALAAYIASLHAAERIVGKASEGEPKPIDY